MSTSTLTANTQQLLGVSLSKTIPLIGSSIEVLVIGGLFTISQGPFSLMVPRCDARALAEALRREPDPEAAAGNSVHRVQVDGYRCSVDASALRSVKTLMTGAFILALPVSAALEVADLLDTFAPAEEAGHA